MLWGAFTFLYIFMPNATVNLRSALVGGLVASLLGVTVGWGFAAFVASSTQYTAIYSSFAILLLFFLWFYAGWLVVLLGAEVAFAHQHLSAYQGGRKASLASMVERERLALSAMLLIGRHFLDGKAPWTVDGLAKCLSAPVRLVTELLHILAEKGLLVPVSDGQAYVPARDLELIGIKEILDTLRRFGEPQTLPAHGDHLEVVDGVIDAVDRAVGTTLGGKSLKTLLSTRDPAGPAC
jgi:membrane protein